MSNKNIYLPQKAKKLNAERDRKKAISKNLIGSSDFYWTAYNPPNLGQLELNRLFRLYTTKVITLPEYRKLVFDLVVNTFKDSVPDTVKTNLKNKKIDFKSEIKKLLNIFYKQCSSPQVPDLNSLKAVCLLINIFTNGSDV